MAEYWAAQTCSAEVQNLLAARQTLVLNGAGASSDATAVTNAINALGDS